MAMLEELFQQNEASPYPPESLLGAITQRRPADPLRSLRDMIPQNKDGGLSMLNMIREALGTSANWLDGTKDPSLIGTQEMVSPLGLMGMAGPMSGALRRGGAAAMADNAKGSAPGTVVNSFAEGGRRGGPAIEEVWGTKFQTHMSKEYEKAVAGGDLSTQFDILSAKYANSLSDSPEIRAAMKAEMDRIEPQVRADEAALREELRQRFGSPPKLLADNARSSAPGTVVNSLDMSEAARMARAKEQGFGEQTYYHGTPDKFDEFQASPHGQFGAGVYASPSKAHASRFGDVMDLKVRGPVATWADIPEDVGKRGFIQQLFQKTTPSQDAAMWARENGFSGFTPEKGGSSAVIFDPRNIRSTQAAFDPAKRDSAMLLAADNAKGSAPGTVLNSMAEGGAAARLKQAMGNEDAFRVELQGLQGMSVPELKALAAEFTGAPAHAIRNKTDALDMIMKRHRNLMDSRAKAEFIKGFGTIEASPSASAPGLAANSTQQQTPEDQPQESGPRAPPVVGETPGRPMMPEDMAPPSLNFGALLQALGAGAVDPFGLTGRGLQAMGFEHPARRLSEMRAEYPTIADMGGVLGPGGALGKAGGMALKEFAPHLLGLAGQVPILSGIVRDATGNTLQPAPRAQAGYPREGAY